MFLNPDNDTAIRQIFIIFAWGVLLVVIWSGSLWMEHEEILRVSIFWRLTLLFAPIICVCFLIFRTVVFLVKKKMRAFSVSLAAAVLLILIQSSSFFALYILTEGYSV